MPGLAEIARDYGDRVGFLTVLINFDNTRDVAIDITESVDAPFITISADTGIFAYGELVGSLFTFNTIPQIIILDGDGNVIENYSGGSDKYRTSLDNALNMLS